MLVMYLITNYHNVITHLAKCTLSFHLIKLSETFDRQIT